MGPRRRRSGWVGAFYPLAVGVRLRGCFVRLRPITLVQCTRTLLDRMAFNKNVQNVFSFLQQDCSQEVQLVWGNF